MESVWFCAAGLCLATIVGAILGFLFKELPHKWNDTILGYCAGIMLAASTLGLIVPAFEAPLQLPRGGETLQSALIAMSVIVGALFLNVLDLVTPHLHHITGLDPEFYNYIPCRYENKRVKTVNYKSHYSLTR